MVTRSFLMALLLLATEAMGKITVKVEVSNTLPVERSNEMVEVELRQVTSMLKGCAGGHFIVTDESGCQVACQQTYDGKLIYVM